MIPRTPPLRRLLGAVTLLTALALGATAAPAVAAPTAARAVGVVAPVIDANFPDPDVLQVGRTYHAYASNSDGRNVQHATSRDLQRWTLQPDVAPVLGDWVDTGCTFPPGGPTDRCVWAPEVAAVDGGYALYYSARLEGTAVQCIGVSTSTSPDGPFTPVGTGPLVCPTAEGGAIDASTYVEGGQRYLLWKTDGNCCGGPAIINIQPLSGDGRTLTGPATELIRNTQPFEGRVVEAPTLVKRDGTYVLIYSANDFGGGRYTTGYATSPSLLGPYTKSPTPLMTTDLFAGTVIGPGGQDVVTAPDGSTKILFHGWDPTYTYRAMHLRDLTWNGATPSVAGVAMRYEAEAGVVTDARVVADAAASAGAKVGGIDLATSSVTLTVTAAKAGPTTLRVRFANGSLDGSGYPVQSSSVLTVNGAAAGEVVYPHTTWGNWQTVEVPVKLVKGSNTITLAKGRFFVELDAVDLG